VTEADKKTWSTPKLRVFVRTRTEEAVLWLCKESTGVRRGALERNNTCYFNTTCSNYCEYLAGS
jgi:hypothetical protein